MQNNFQIIVQWLMSLAYTYHYKSKHWYIDAIHFKKFDKMTNIAKIVKNKCKVTLLPMHIIIGWPVCTLCIYIHYYASMHRYKHPGTHLHHLSMLIQLDTCSEILSYIDSAVAILLADKMDVGYALWSW